MRAAVLLALSAALAGCQSSTTSTCPGTPVAHFTFTATQVPGSACAFAGSLGSPLVFQGTLAWDPDGGAAALCLDTPRALPHTGTHAGDHVVVQAAFGGVSISGCGCPADVVEVVEGDVQRDGADGGVGGFSGTLADQAAPSGTVAGGDGGPADGGSCGCGLPCEVDYAVQGVP